MSIKQSPTLLFMAAIASLCLNILPASAATPGPWIGYADFGTVEFVVNTAGTAIEKVTYRFESYKCGIVTSSGTFIISNGAGWSITNNEFSFSNNLGPGQTMTISGTFESATEASGPFEAVFEGTTCPGTWSTSGSAANEAPFANNDGPGGKFKINQGGKLTLAASDMSANDTDAEDGSPPGGDVTIKNLSSGLSLVTSGQNFTFSHDGRGQSSTSFTYTIKDSDGATSNTATVTLTVKAQAASGGFSINRYLSGSWYNASQNGHGFSIEVLDDNTVVIYWYMYTPTGHSMFLLGVGRVEGNRVIADTYVYQGMIWGEFDPADLEEIYWGELIIEFHDCGNATLTYSSNVTYGDVPFGSGTIKLVRLLDIQGMQCSDNMHAGIYEGSFRSDETGNVHTGTMLLTTGGEFVAFSYQDTISFGTYSVTGQDFTGAGTALSADPDVYFSAAVTVAGEILPDYRLVGTYDISGGESGTCNGWSASSLYRRGVTLDSISGDWNTLELINGERGSATISPNGNVTGSDETGCTYTGKLTIPDTRFNMLEVTVTITNCGDGNGTYSGFGYQTDAFDLGDGGVIRVFVGDGAGTSAVDLWR